MFIGNKKTEYKYSNVIYYPPSTFSWFSIFFELHQALLNHLIK